MNTSVPRPVAVQPGAGRILESLGVTHILTGRETSGAYYLGEATFAPESGGRLHIHHREDEVIFVLEGAIEIRLPDAKLHIPAGGTVHLPKGIPHALHNPLKTELRFMFHAIPAGLENFFDELDAAIAAGTLDADKYTVISARYGLEWLE